MVSVVLLARGNSSKESGVQLVSAFVLENVINETDTSKLEHRLGCTRSDGMIKNKKT